MFKRSFRRKTEKTVASWSNPGEVAERLKAAVC